MRTASFALVAALLVGCVDSSVSACSTFLNVVDQIRSGSSDFETVQARIERLNFRPGSGLDSSRDRLLRAFEDGDEASATDETFYLEEQCSEVVDSARP